MNRDFLLKRYSIIGALLIFILVSTSCSMLLPTEQEVLAPPLAEPPQPRYNLYTVARGDIADQYNGGGVFIPMQEINAHFGNNAGRLMELNVKAGDVVSEGDLLAKLDVDELEFNLVQMADDLRKTRLNNDKLKLDQDKLRADEKAAAEMVAAAEDEQAKREALNRLDEVKRQRRKFDIDMEIHAVNLRQQERNYNRTQQRIRDAELRAPIDGVVNFTGRLVVGDWINAYQTLFTIVDPSVLYLRTQPPLLNRFQVGMTARVTIQDQEYPGTVVMSPAATNVEITDERFNNAVIIEVEDLPETVQMGDNAGIFFIFEQRENVVVIPKAGLRNYGTRDYVVVRHDGVNRELDVEKGMETATMVEITLGLEEGEQIILR